MRHAFGLLTYGLHVALVLVALVVVVLMATPALAVDCIGPDDPPGCVTPSPTPTVTVTETVAADPDPQLTQLDDDLVQFRYVWIYGGGLLLFVGAALLVVVAFR